MKVDGLIPPPMHIRHNPSTEVGVEGFAEILGKVAKDDETAQNGVSVAKVDPQIGDSAVGFAEKSMVLLTALHFDSPWDLVEPDGELGAHAVLQITDPYGARMIAPLGSKAESVTERAIGAGQLAAYVRADAMHALATKNPAVVSVSPRNPAAVPTASGVTSPQTAAASTSVSTKVEAQQAAQLDAEPAPPVRYAERSGSRTAVTANLFAVENGFRLVLRTPAMKAEERSELVRRLAELFAEHSRFQPELLIFHPQATDRG